REARLIRYSEANIKDLAPKVQEILAAHHAAVEAFGSVYPGIDDTAKHFTRTPEVKAIHAAIFDRKAQMAGQPWDLGGATLYTRTGDIGPMAYAECQWAHVTSWVHVRGGADFAEAPGISN